MEGGTILSNLYGRTIVVTGAARGMGRAVAERCTKDGAHVIAVDLNSGLEDWTSSADTTRYIGDVTDRSFAAEVFNNITRDHGRVDGLVNVVGIHAAGNALEVSKETWDRTLSVNLTGTLLWCQAALSRMITTGGGSIINFGSVVSTHARPSSIAYVASKSAVLGLSRSIAIDFGASGVRCNVVSPGSIDTPMYREAADRRGASLQEQAAAAYMGRLGTVAEIAGTCAFLLSDDGGYVNGANIVVDGARTAGT
ncbi:SDR family NAD(P)-dependent oxidoreductase [Specibacter sp. RAF43]|uniref:SDR family NAD(P)-dependent oxidoreductase n=1 Tax=Specibacter sp. RAF43 TaxID=3233057 RepID=UPI003F9E6D37